MNVARVRLADGDGLGGVVVIVDVAEPLSEGVLSRLREGIVQFATRLGIDGADSVQVIEVSHAQRAVNEGPVEHADDEGCERS